MAPEEQTAEPNSTETPTETSGQTGSPTSTTEQTDQTSDSQQTDEGDPLDGPEGIAGETEDEKTAREAEEARRAALTDEERAAEDAAAAAEAEQANPLHGAPEDAYEIELPEGMTLDPVALEAITPLAKELNLSNAGLSKLASEAYPLVEKQVATAQIGQVVALRKAWETDSRALISGGKLADGTAVEADPVFAGENFDTVMATAAKAIDRLAGNTLFPNAKAAADGSLEPGTFRDYLKLSGHSLHPAMVRAFYLAGKQLSEDNDFERTGDTPPAKLTREQKYYPPKQT